MKRILIVLIIMHLGLCFLFSDRMAPKAVSPVNYSGNTYKVNHEKMGIIEIYDNKTGAVTKEIRVYSVFYNPFLEKDVQDVYIRDIFIKNNFLIVINEKGSYFTVDINNYNVKKLNEDEVRKIKGN